MLSPKKGSRIRGGKLSSLEKKNFKRIKPAGWELEPIRHHVLLTVERWL